METPRYVYIMDYSNPSIYELDLINEEDNDIERILRRYNLNIDECDYMYSNFKLKIETLNDGEE